MKKIRTAEDINPDPRNANRGRQRGRELVQSSIEQFGAGRSIVIDREGTVIAGNKTFDEARALGLPVRAIETDGSELVAVQRTDLLLDDEQDQRARLLAYADNRASELGLDWDASTMSDDIESGLELGDAGFSGAEVDLILSEIAGIATNNDPLEEWQGMPEFDGDTGCYRKITVSFESEEDVVDFFKLIGQSHTDKTKSIWHPYRERRDLESMRWGSDDPQD